METLKLQAVKSLSQGLSTVTAYLLLFIVGSALVLIVAMGLILLLGEQLGSYALAAFIVAGGLLVIFLILLATKKFLFRNSFIRAFAAPLRTKEQLEAAILKSQAQEYRDEARIISEFSAITGPVEMVSGLFRRFLGKK